MLFGLFFLLLLKSSYVQTQFARAAAAYLSNRLNTEVSVDRLEFIPFRSISLNGLLINDQSNDTLLYVSAVGADVRRFNIDKGKFDFERLDLEGASLRLSRIDSNHNNLDFLIQYFSSDENKDNSSSGSDLNVSTLSIVNADFSYVDPFNSGDERLVSFYDLAISEINAEIIDLQAQGDSLICSIEDLRFKEKSGLEVERFSALTKLNKHGIDASNLNLKTPNSDVQGRVALNHENWSDYNDFINSVEWDTEFSASKVGFRDIGYFADQLYHADLELLLHGLISGSISNLNGRRMLLLIGDKTVIRGNIDLNGLPDFENTFIDFRITEFVTDMDDLLSIGQMLPISDPIATILPVELQRAGEISFKGQFTGFPQDFVTYGRFESELGQFSADLNLSRDTLFQGLTYSGSLSAERISLGSLFDNADLGTVSGEFTINAKSRTTFEEADIQGNIHDLTYKGYTYRGIRLDGFLEKKRFLGKLNSLDPNFLIDFDGLVDFSTTTQFYDFDATIGNLNLTQLQLIDFEKELSIATVLTLDAKGQTVEDFVGNLSAMETLICYGDSTLEVDNVKLTVFGDSLNRKISFDSDIVDVSVTGEFDPINLPVAFNNMIAEIVPAVAEYKELEDNENFQFSLNYSASNSVSSLLFPGFSIAANSSFYGSFNSGNRTFELSMRSPRIEFGQFRVDGISAEFGKISEVFKGRIFAVDFYYDSLRFENPDIDLEAYNNFIDLKTGWFGTSSRLAANLQVHADISAKDHFVIEVEPGSFTVKDTRWMIDELASFEKDSLGLSISKFAIHTGEQTFRLNGRLGNTSADTLFFGVDDFSLATLDSMGLNPYKKVGGLLNLEGSVANFYDIPSVNADGNIIDFSVGNQLLGDLTVKSSYKAKSESLLLSTELLRNETKLIAFAGNYSLGEQKKINGNLKLDDFDLYVLNEFEIPEISSFSGLADGTILVSGKAESPLLEGYVDFDNAKFTIDYLNTSFTYSDRVRVENDFFGIDYKPLYDSKDGVGYVVASAFHDNYTNWSYDITADVEEFYALNTTREENKLFYGQAYATGTIQFGGFDDKLEINIDATSEKGTEISLPLDESEDVALENFVHFVNEEQTVTEDREIDLSGVDLLLNIDATPDAKVNIIFDEKAGDILSGRGQGKLTLETTPAGDFTMFGRYEILSGDYNFTLRSLINKRFTLRPGGTIGWYGDPYNADLEMAAIYSLRTPLIPIMIENPELYRSRELVNVVLNLGGKLTLPSINFEIELPQATENERTQLASAVSTANQLNQQVFALLILNKFIAISAPDQAGTGVVSGLAALTNTSTSEFISNQLSGWLSEISNEFDIGLNYRPGDQITNQEIAVALSTQLFDERLLVSGSFGVTSANEAQVTQGQSGILGDFLLEYMLTPDGRIRLKVFNETNPYEVFSTSTSMYTQGVGLIYQEDFDTIDQFFKKIGELFKDDEASSLP